MKGGRKKRENKKKRERKKKERDVVKYANFPLIEVSVFEEWFC